MRRDCLHAGVESRELFESPLSQEDQRGEQDQEWYHPGKNLIVRARQQHTPDQSTNDADGDKSPKPDADGGEVFAVAKEASRHAEHERQCAGGVGHLRLGMKKQERGKCNKGTSTRNGVNHPGNGGSGEKREDFDGCHGGYGFAGLWLK